MLEYCRDDHVVKFDRKGQKCIEIIIKPMMIVPMQRHWLVPVSSVYVNENDENHFKQIFVLCFDIGGMML